MFNLEPSALEKDIYSFVMGKLKAEGNNFSAYEKVEDALIVTLQEIIAQHKAAVHYSNEALKIRGEQPND